MSEDQTPVSVRAAGNSVVTYRFGGREYPMKTVPRCLTCMSPYRFEIEKAIIQGRSYRKIEEMLGGYGEEFAISHRAIADHYYRDHMPLELSDTRQVVEERARSVGKSIEDSVESLVDGVTLMQTVVRKSFEEIASGRAVPDVKSGLQAAKLLSDLGEYDGHGVDQQAYVEAFMVYQEEAERIMGPEAFAAFGEALEQNETLKALAARYEGEPVPGEAEVVEEPADDAAAD